jgi:hypothetical protein
MQSSLQKLCEGVKQLPTELIPFILSFSHTLEITTEVARELIKTKQSGVIKILFGRFHGHQIRLLYTNVLFSNNITVPISTKLYNPQPVLHQDDFYDEDDSWSDSDEEEEQEEESIELDNTPLCETLFAPLILNAQCFTCYFHSFKFMKPWEKTTPELTRLSILLGTRTIDYSMRNVVHCTELVYLNLHFYISASIFDDIVTHLHKLRTLKILQVEKDNTKRNKSIRKYPNGMVLEHNCLVELMVRKWTLPFLPIIPSLKRLSLGGFPVSLNENISLMKSITDIDITVNSDTNTLMLTNLSSLTRLSLNGEHDADQIMELLANLESIKAPLKSLVIENNNGIEADAMVPCKLDLKTINLHNCAVKYSNEWKQYLAQFHGVTKLDLNSCKITDDTADLMIRSMPHLAFLNLSCNEITTKGLLGIHTLTALKEFHFHKLVPDRNMELKEDHVSIIKNCLRHCNSLERLTLSNLCVDDEGACLLAEMPNLKQIRFGTAPIGNLGTRALFSSTSLTDLSLFACIMNDMALAPLSNNTTLRKLNLHNCNNLTPACSKILFIQNTTITELFLGDIDIVIAGVQWVLNDLTPDKALHTPMRSVYIPTNTSDDFVLEAQKCGILLPLHNL